MSNTSPSPKFYHAENANRIIRFKGQAFQFWPYQHLGGSWYGVLRVDDTKQQAALDELIQDPMSAVTAIDQKQYALCLQKKAHNDQRSGILSAPQPPPPTTGRIPDVSVVGSPVTSELPPPAPEIKPLGTVEDALSVGNVTNGSPTTDAPARLDLPPIGNTTTGVDLS